MKLDIKNIYWRHLFIDTVSNYFGLTMPYNPALN